MIQVKSGETCFLWMDAWQPQTLQNTYPECFSFAKNKYISLAEAMSNNDLPALFNLPVSQVAFGQLQQI